MPTTLSSTMPICSGLKEQARAKLRLQEPPTLDKFCRQRARCSCIVVHRTRQYYSAIKSHPLSRCQRVELTCSTQRTGMLRRSQETEVQRTLSSVREEVRISLRGLLSRFWSSLFPDELSILCARRCPTVFPDRSDLCFSVRA